jgi:NAD(P)-dependent dehydrogenase (short-subunit alcohol dehydrogenase family)
MNESSDFNGKVALVTGGGGGIGRATALAFAAQGAKVVVADLPGQSARETVRLIQSRGGDALFVSVDVTQAAQVAAMVATAVQHYGGLSFAVNNAGIEGSARVPVADYDEDTWQAVIAVNLSGVFLCMKHELPAILKTRGAIVNMASVAGLSGSKIGAAYHASKHGVVGLTKAAALEYADQGVRINAVAPAVIQTPMAKRLQLVDSPAAARVLAAHPMGRLGTPEDVAAAVLWLCSGGASFVTGHTLPVDGGMLIP